MPSDLSELIVSLLPRGAAWTIDPGGDWQKFIDGGGLNWGVIKDFCSSLANIRDPQTTTLLEDLEREYGVITNDALTTATRRDRLEALVYARERQGSLDGLQDQITNAGFSCIVVANDPAVDPATFVTDADLLVNGDIVLDQGLVYSAVANGPFSFAGNVGMGAGAYTGVALTLKDYHIPDLAGRWNYIFYIAGGASGWDDLEDGDMEEVGTIHWTAGAKAAVTKVLTPHRSGVQGLEVQGLNDCGRSAYAEQLGSWGVAARTVKGYAWGDGASGFPAVYVKDPVSGLWSWIWGGTTSTSRQYFSVAVPGGVSGVRLYMFGDPNGAAYFDDISIFTPLLTACNVDADREYEFKKLILRYKPLHSWAALKVAFV